MKRTRNLSNKPKYSGFFSDINDILDGKETNNNKNKRRSSKRKKGLFNGDTNEDQELHESSDNSLDIKEDEPEIEDKSESEDSIISIQKSKKIPEPKDKKQKKRHLKNEIKERAIDDIDINQKLSIKVNDLVSNNTKAGSNKKINNAEGKDEVITKPIPIPSYRPFDIYNYLKFDDPELEDGDSRVIFVRPKNHYLRANELIPESKLAVEYDLDLEDKAWLEVICEKLEINTEVLDMEEIFELFMDRIEKNWFIHSKQTEKQNKFRTSELNPDTPCEICKETDCENSNAIIFCDGCDLAVHQDCYGVPYIPEGQWLCRKCIVSPSNPVTCILCPNEGGAFKQTGLNSWAHVLCAIWIPEVSFGSSVYIEPIEGVDTIPKSRWKLICYLCKQRKGACVQCSVKSCSASFHVTCAFFAKFTMKYKVMPDSLSTKPYCHRHVSKDNKDQADIQEVQGYFAKKFSPKKVHKKDSKYAVFKTSSSKAAIAHQQAIDPSPEIISMDVFHHIISTETEVKTRKKNQILLEICKYWTLKKGEYRNVPFIRRLHLEPWTASTPLQSEEEKVIIYENLVNIKDGLEKVQKITSLIRQREAYKLELIRYRYNYWESFLFPMTKYFRSVLLKLISDDKTFIFTQPVSKEQAPDYHNYIKNPMDFATLSSLVDNHEVRDLNTFKEKLLLIFSNCMFYNDDKSIYYKTAAKFKKNALTMLSNIQKEISRLDIDSDTGFLNVRFDTEAAFSSNKIRQDEESNNELSEEDIVISGHDTPNFKETDNDILYSLDTIEEKCNAQATQSENQNMDKVPEELIISPISPQNEISLNKK
ncbi:hypothetical protein K502DRAFT_331936 [Neoconidiobolus thromboides FSU 785]|nr:hypothetical protein K502DRAFT_331936 [Neoconidiobolus thromboides FSU 785]